MFTKPLFFILIEFLILSLISVSESGLAMIRKTEQWGKFLAVSVLSRPFAFDFLVFSRISVMRRILLLEARHQMSLFPQTGWCWQNSLCSSHLLPTHNDKTKEGAPLQLWGPDRAARSGWLRSCFWCSPFPLRQDWRPCQRWISRGKIFWLHGLFRVHWCASLIWGSVCLKKIKTLYVATLVKLYLLSKCSPKYILKVILITILISIRPEFLLAL